jgi:hypothetical protein
MAMLREWFTRLCGALRPGRDDRDLEEELRLHLDLEAEAERHRGTSPESARRIARVKLGGMAPVMETLRDQRGLPWLDDLARDVRHGYRLLRRSPVVTGAAALSLSLGIGANSAVFSYADALLLRPLPVPDPDAVVTVMAASPEESLASGVSYVNYQDLRAQSRSFDSLIAHRRSTFSFARSRGATREMRVGRVVSENFFDGLGVRPALGRGFRPDEGLVPGRDAVVVLGHDFWSTALAGDVSVVGEILQINDIEFTVIGVAPASFTGVEPTIRPAFYVPAMMTQRLSSAPDDSLDDRATRWFTLKGRLMAGVSRADAQAELATLWTGLERASPDANRNRTLTVLGEGEHRRLAESITASAVTRQMALVAIVLLVAAGVFLDGGRRSLAFDPGFRTDHLLMMTMDTSLVGYGPFQTRDFYGTLVERAGALSGVASVALTSDVPLDRGGSVERVIPDGHQLPPGQEHAVVFSAIVDEHYFDTMRTEIVRGRAFTVDDQDGASMVAIVNEAFATTYWPGQNPVGKRFRLNDSGGPWLRVVGLTRTGKYLWVGEPQRPFLYLPFDQHQRTRMSVLVETTSHDAAALAGPLRDVVGALDVSQPVFNVRTVSSFYEQRAIAVLARSARAVGILGLVGLALALVGLYGLIANSVMHRTREIGIRMAVGADRSDVLKMVLRQGLVLSGAGVLAGGLLSAASVRLLTASVAGLGTANPAIFVIVPAVLICLTMAACYIPARHASRVDPLVAFRCE